MDRGRGVCRSDQSDARSLPLLLFDDWVHVNYLLCMLCEEQCDFNQPDPGKTPRTREPLGVPSPSQAVDVSVAAPTRNLPL